MIALCLRTELWASDLWLPRRDESGSLLVEKSYGVYLEEEVETRN